MVARPKKMSATPYLGPDPLIDCKQGTETIAIATEDTHHYETQYKPPYSTVKVSIL